MKRISEDEIMKTLDEMEEHYDALAQKQYEKGNAKKSDSWDSVAYACHTLRRRLKTKFKNIPDE